MHETTYERDGFFDCKYKKEMTINELYNKNIGCGSILGFPYFISFTILSTIIFLEFFSAVISCAMDDIYPMNLEEIKTGDINKLKLNWLFLIKNALDF